MSHLHHRISALIDGELSPNARTRALAHARSCPECRRELAETLEVKRRISQLAPVEVSTDLLDVVTSLHPCPVRASAAGRPRLLRKVVVGLGSVSAVVIALAYVVGAPPEQAQARFVSPPIGEFTADFADSTGLAPLADPAVGGLATERSGGSASSIGFGSKSPLPQAGQRAATAPNDPPSSALAAPTTTASPGDDPQAVLLLETAVVAPAKYGFRATRVIRSFTPSGTETLRVEVMHTPGQGTRFHVLGATGKIVSDSFVPDADAASDGLEGRPLGPLEAAYDLAIEGPQQVDGRKTMVIAARDGSQLRARFWIDVETGLLLRRALYADGLLVRWSGYTSFDVTRHFMSHVPPEVPTMPATTVATSVAAALNDKGWTCPRWLNSTFRLSSLRQLDTDAGAMHAEYTDGLSTVSVFEERGTLDTSTLAGFQVRTVDGMTQYVREGLPTVAVWGSDGMVYTVVTDAPEQLSGALIARFPHDGAEPVGGFTTRLGHGLSRMASAVAP